MNIRKELYKYIINNVCDIIFECLGDEGYNKHCILCGKTLSTFNNHKC